MDNGLLLQGVGSEKQGFTLCKLSLYILFLYKFEGEHQVVVEFSLSGWCDFPHWYV